MLSKAKIEFLSYHPEWEAEKISNNKIIYEAIKFYIKTGRKA